MKRPLKFRKPHKEANRPETGGRGAKIREKIQAVHTTKMGPRHGYRSEVREFETPAGTLRDKRRR